MAVTFTNGFTEYGATEVLFPLVQTGQAPNYVPFGTRNTTTEQSWGYGKTDTVGLPTPQAFAKTFEQATQKVNFTSNSSPFDIVLNGASNITVVGVQILKADNTPVLEVSTTSPAVYIYDGEFTILAGSYIDFGTNVSFYAQ